MCSVQLLLITDAERMTVQFDHEFLLGGRHGTTCAPTLRGLWPDLASLGTRKFVRTQRRVVAAFPLACLVGHVHWATSRSKSSHAIWSCA